MNGTYQTILNVLQLLVGIAGVYIAYMTYQSATTISNQIAKAKAETTNNAQFSNTYQEIADAIDETLELLKRNDKMTVVSLIETNKIANRINVMSATWDRTEQSAIKKFVEDSNSWTQNTKLSKEDPSIKGTCIVHLNKVKSVLEHRRFM